MNKAKTAFSNESPISALMDLVTGKTPKQPEAARAVFMEFDQVVGEPRSTLDVVKSFAPRELALSTMMQLGHMVNKQVMTEEQALNVRTVVVEQLDGTRHFLRRPDLAAAFTANIGRIEALAARKGNSRMPAILHAQFGTQDGPTAPMPLYRDPAVGLDQ